MKPVHAVAQNRPTFLRESLGRAPSVVWRLARDGEGHGHVDGVLWTFVGFCVGGDDFATKAFIQVRHETFDALGSGAKVEMATKDGARRHFLFVQEVPIKILR